MLSAFVDNFKKANKAPNMTALAKSDMPNVEGEREGYHLERNLMTIPKVRIPLTTPALQEHHQHNYKFLISPSLKINLHH